MKLRQTLAALGLALSIGGVAHGQVVQGLDGRWEGPIVLGNGATITGVFRVETKDGKTVAVMDSPDQGATDIPATVKRDGARVTFDVPAAGATYDATLSADGRSLTGSLFQGGGAAPLSMTLKPAGSKTATVGGPGPLVQGLDGRWEGDIVTPNGSLSSVFRISSSDGKTTTVMDVPTQGAKDIPAATSRDGQKVTIKVPGIAASYSAELSADGKTLTGFWDQAGQSFPLVIAKK